jgi:hypothetical protein
MTTLFVQYSDSSEATIISVFAGPQDAATFPNQGQVETSDSRYAAYFSAMPSIAKAGLQQPD